MGVRALTPYSARLSIISLVFSLLVMSQLYTHTLISGSLKISQSTIRIKDIQHNLAHIFRNI